MFRQDQKRFIKVNASQLTFKLISIGNWPECLASAGCPAVGDRCETGCPGVRDAVCSQNCDCSTVFTDRRSGRVLRDVDCFPKSK